MRKLWPAGTRANAERMAGQAGALSEAADADSQRKRPPAAQPDGACGHNEG